MTDCNAGSYTDYNSIVYYDTASNTWQPYFPGCIENVRCGPYLTEHEIDEKYRKEKTMIDRQTFLDALADEGKAIMPEERDVIRDAKADKWELFIARLLARVFESADLAILKEKPKEVLIKEA